MSTRYIKKLVTDLLKEAGIVSPPVDVFTIARNLDAEVREAAFEDDVSGMLVKENGRVLIGINKENSYVRQRFTVAHEIGHMLLHSEPLYVDRQYTIKMRDGRSGLAVDPHEIEANSFAAELLMPTHFLLEDVRGLHIDYENDAVINELASMYEVSPQAMTFRLTNIGIIESQW